MEPNEDLVSRNRATRTKELDSYKSDDGALDSDGECKGEKEKIATRPVEKEQLQVYLKRWVQYSVGSTVISRV